MPTKCPECFATSTGDHVIKCAFCGTVTEMVDDGKEVTDKQIDNTFNANPKKLTDFKITKKQEITPLGFFALALQEKEEVTPESGFNVCVYDSWEKLGENLTIAAWFETKEEAETYANEQRQNGSIMYIYGAKLDKQQAK